MRRSAASTTGCGGYPASGRTAPDVATSSFTGHEASATFALQGFELAHHSLSRLTVSVAALTHGMPLTKSQRALTDRGFAGALIIPRCAAATQLGVGHRGDVGGLEAVT